MKSKMLILSSFLLGLFLLGLFPVTASTNPDSFLVLSTEDPQPPEWQTVGNGEKLNLTARNRYQIRTQSGNQLRIQVNDCVQLRINESDENPAGILPNRTRAINKYMHLTMNQTCLMNATMFRNFTSQQLLQLGNASTFQWAYYNEYSYQWEYAYENWVEYRPDGATVYCNTTHFSVWVILAPGVGNPTPGVPFTPENGTGFAVQAGNLYKIQTQSGFTIQVQLQEAAQINITEYDDSPKVMNQNRMRIRTKTMAVELNTSVQLQANFSYTFTNQIKNQLGVKNMEKLRFMFFNETLEEWQAPKHQWIEGETLYCNTTHFSLWTIAEDEGDTSIPGFEFFSILLAIVPVVVIKSRRK